MVRYVRSPHVAVWLVFAVLLGLGAPLASVASPRAESWIAVSAATPLRTGAIEVAVPTALDPLELQRELLETVLTASAAAASGDVTVLVTVRDPDAPERELVRVAGADRYETALQASANAFAGGAPAVVLATGANWPDALGGSALAGAVRGPLLLTTPKRLPDAVRAEIARLGASRVYILGGTAAVASTVESDLVGMLGRSGVVRLGGPDRYETARLVAEETVRVFGGGYSGDALVATGANFPDATGGAALAAALGRPILLANPGSGAVYIPAATRRVTIIGGTAAVSSGVEQTLKARLGASNVARAGGTNRYETAVLVAQMGVAGGMTWDGVSIATGANFPDALAGGAMLGARGSVMLLTRPDVLSAEVEAVIVANREGIETVFIFGGTNAVSTDVEDALRAALMM